MEKDMMEWHSLRIEISPAAQVSVSKPRWLKIRPPTGQAINNYSAIRNALDQLGLHTVCEQARCPNINECWGGGTATFMVMGDTCTRGCRFCSVKTSAKPPPLDPQEPKNLARALSAFDLSYIVITSVDRDDLPDQGAGHFCSCVEKVRRQRPEMIVELLIPDFRGERDCIDTIISSGAQVIGHNLETVKRLQEKVRDRRANYAQSLGVLEYIKKKSPGTFTKSALMLGLGEREVEVLQAMDDLRTAGVDFLTLGQYLQPTARHLPIEEFIAPEKFEWYAQKAKEKGFLYCAAGPFVRSSYRAGEFFMENAVRKKQNQKGSQKT